MIPEEKFLEIARGLLEKTKRGKVKWTEADPSTVTGSARARPTEASLPLGKSWAGSQMSPRRENIAYRAPLPNSTVFIGFFSPTAEPDYVQLHFCGPDGKLAGAWVAEEGTDNWDLALKLFSEVQRYVTKWDKVLEDVEKFISSDA